MYEMKCGWGKSGEISVAMEKIRLYTVRGGEVILMRFLWQIYLVLHVKLL